MTILLGTVLYIGVIWAPGPVRYFVTTDRKEMCASIEKNMGARGGMGIFRIKLGMRNGYIEPTYYSNLCLEKK